MYAMIKLAVRYKQLVIGYYSTESTSCHIKSKPRLFLW